MVEKSLYAKYKDLSPSNGNDEQTIVIDMGSDTVKAGFAGEDVPRAVFRNIVGRPSHSMTKQGISNKSEYIGDEAMHADL